MDRSLDAGQFHDEYATYSDREGNTHDVECSPMVSIIRPIFRSIALCADNTRQSYFNPRHEPSTLELADLRPRMQHEQHRMFTGKRRRPGLILTRTLVIALPCMILMALGVIHILQALLGRERLLWNSPSSNGLPPPTWSRPDRGRMTTEVAAARLFNVLPVPCHSHNDYWRDTPLLEAISLGAISVEADIWTFDEELYVGHNVGSLTPQRTFRQLYTQPLIELLNRSTSEISGLFRPHIFGADPKQTLVLLVDFKNKPSETWRLLEKQLEPLRQRGYLTVFDGVSTDLRAITVVATGKAPFNLISGSGFYQDVFFDAPLDELWQPPRLRPLSNDDQRTIMMDYGTAMASPQDAETDDLGPIIAAKEEYNSTNSYYASVSFKATIGNVWRGHLSPHQMKVCFFRRSSQTFANLEQMIRGHIRGARQRNLKVRYWDTPIWPISLRNHVWHVLVKEGADVLSVDDVAACAMSNWQVKAHGWL